MRLATQIGIDRLEHADQIRPEALRLIVLTIERQPRPSGDRSAALPWLALPSAASRRSHRLSSMVLPAPAGAEIRKSWQPPRKPLFSFAIRPSRGTEAGRAEGVASFVASNPLFGLPTAGCGTSAMLLGVCKVVLHAGTTQRLSVLEIDGGVLSRLVLG